MITVTKETNEWRESEQRRRVRNENKLKGHRNETRLNIMLTITSFDNYIGIEQ